ncbi:cell division protein ZapA [Croceicoccus bisphenolivorans]|uniref:cell division protein ZapA n=1 Tax=Croceicoccus bisphenolivorans TaxID=1783232 RepID=UPI0008352F59|nr:cell division protein ZapA [Croceicoccus bisphenolivorans]
MANLDLEIGGRRFAISCKPGEESHIALLGRMIDTRVRDAGAVGQSEPRMLLFGALVLADELHAMREGNTGPAIDRDEDKAIAKRIDSITSRIENIVRHLEGEDHHA